MQLITKSIYIFCIYFIYVCIVTSIFFCVEVFYYLMLETKFNQRSNLALHVPVIKVMTCGMGI